MYIRACINFQIYRLVFRHRRPMNITGAGNPRFHHKKTVLSEIENNTWVCIDMKFLYACLTWELKYECSKRARYQFEHKKRNFISTSNHVLLCLSYKQNSPITEKKSQLFLINENKRIDNPQMKILKCIGTKAQDEKMHRNTTKTNNGRNFQFTKFSVIDLVLADRRNLSGT